MSSEARKQASVSVDATLLSDARDLDIDVSRVAETGLAAAVKAERERRWRLENAEAIKAYNDDVEKNGLPLAKYRQF
ncbi:antitoxin CcdA [Neorhizobium huautlense]|uniref:Antitoxin CcdA n=1 Tax=Neorhizobium huautlense TaxID=67774 RepID=A0ABT9PLT0_9HYPH|nr:type II toxin-antitoxin system CcdA family antitoxin [Neorhizobium huautlense]MDP9835421.1 antitoxin CcdA [Neorhizobium huautlense]